MSFMLALMAFILILVGVVVQVGHFTSETKFAVTWTTVIAALGLILFSAKVYFS